MAKDIQIKKRKASEPEAEIEKVKKVKKTVAAAPEVQAKKRKATEEAASAAVKKSKTPKSTEDKPAEKTNGAGVATKTSTASKNVNGAAKTKKVKETLSNERISPSEDENEDVDSEIDDQTEALLKGFDSDGDEGDAENEEGLKEGQEVPKVPKLSKPDQKKIKAVDDGEEEPGVVYVGRIPHGFYENEMKQYFKQFGPILKLRLSRNRKTGASKHYAFIQFESATVADIVAKTMDNYLLFNHILKVKTIPDEQLPVDLFKGANKRFKKVPWNKIEGRKLEQGACEEIWEERAEKEEERRAGRAEKLKAIGYEFEAPKIKSAKGISKKQAITNGDAEVKAMEVAPTVEESAKPKKKYKAAKEEIMAIEAAPAVQEPEKPKKKEKKPKFVKEVEAVVEKVEAVPAEETKPMQKKTKKGKTVEINETASPTEVTENKLQTKKSKGALAEKAVVANMGAEKVKKAKKAKKEKST